MYLDEADATEKKSKKSKKKRSAEDTETGPCQHLAIAKNKSAHIAVDLCVSLKAACIFSTPFLLWLTNHAHRPIG